MALGVQLAATAKPVKKELSKGIARVLALLVAEHAALSKALRDQVTLDTAETADNADTVGAQRTWSTTFHPFARTDRRPSDHLRSRPLEHNGRTR
jgi:hypothetical protein